MSNKSKGIYTRMPFAIDRMRDWNRSAITPVSANVFPVLAQKARRRVIVTMLQVR